MEHDVNKGEEAKKLCFTKGIKMTELNQTLMEIIERSTYESMFDFLKSVTADLGEDRSFYSMDFGEVLWKYQQWKEELPRVTIYYAVKANPDPRLLQFLVIIGSSFDCATVGEIRAVLQAGCTPEKIVFANPNITKKDLKYAKQVSVDLLTFDSEEQLFKIHSIYPNCRLLLRIKPPQVDCKFDFSEKFGCSLDEGEYLLKKAKEIGMEIVGVSFHVGSLNTCGSAFSSALKDARHIFDIGESLGFRFYILDIGGGFHGSVGSDCIFKKVAATIREDLSNYFPNDSVQVIGEPGCYIICSAVTLTTTVFAKRTAPVTNGQSPSAVKQMYFLNNGIYSSFAPGLHQYNIYPVPLLDQDEQRTCHLSTFYGQTLCSMDVIKRDVLFPDLKVGESVVWINMGAYSRSLCTEFCGFSLPDFKYVFRMNSRLKMDWMTKNKLELCKFLASYSHIISQDDKSRIINMKENSSTEEDIKNV